MIYLTIFGYLFMGLHTSLMCRSSADEEVRCTPWPFTLLLWPIVIPVHTAALTWPLFVRAFGYLGDEGRLRASQAELKEAHEKIKELEANLNGAQGYRGALPESQENLHP